MVTLNLNTAFRAATLSFLVCIVPLAHLGAQGVSSISDDSSLRKSLDATLLRAPASKVLARKSERRELPDGSKVEVRVERGKTEFMIVIAREGDGTFPVSAPGGWALYRRYSDGEATRIRLFPSADPYCYVQLRPDGGNRTLMDSVVYGGYISRSVVLPLSFDRVIIEPFSSLLLHAGALFPRRYFEPKSENYADIRALSAAVRSRLGTLTYVDDGAFDEHGKSVFIKTGEAQEVPNGVNCSGFVKWLVDGMLRPLGKERLAISPLKRPPIARGSSFTEPYDDILDPYFGLDWIRNLAAAAGRAFYGERGADPLEYEIKTTPIVSVRIAGGDGSSARAYPLPAGDNGFLPEGLKATLYALAVDEPGHLYLGSINRDIGKELRLRRFYHVAAFLPQFDEQGKFSIVVFESAVESDFDGFLARYAGHMIHLVRLPVESAFNP